ncbi:MAG: hypothetical protein HQK65_03795 [Desulfamplus sp.]|nr:hypothetical protein [Desulfamplus sp.]
MLLNLTDSKKNSFTEPTFIAACFVLWLILFVRITKGLDLTDEMQYYGEIKGLIESGKLFSNDLFIQQSVYILLFPVFYLYHLVFDFEGLVFFSRLLMAMLSVAVFLYAYRKLIELKFSFAIASLTALALTFAILYHGVFAPSYNTISQFLWIVFTLRFYEWKKSSVFLWGIIPLITAFAHPTSAVMMALLIFVRLLVEREFKKIIELFLVFLGGGLIVSLIVFYFATPQEYLASLAFSSGYGVGTAFFSGKSQPITLFVIYAMFGIVYATFGVNLLFRGCFHKLSFAWLTISGTTAAIVLFLAGLARGAYTPRIIYVLSSLSALVYGWSLSNTPEDNIKFKVQIHWLIVLLLGYATTIGVTSSNGIGQSTGAFMVGLPLLLGIAVNSAPNRKTTDDFLKLICPILLVILYIAHWSRYPYRENVWWKTNQPIQSVPEFKFISTSQDRIEFIQRMKQELQPIVQDKSTLIISEFPVLYFVLNAHTETCMLYMHSLTSDKSEKALLNCFINKNPEIIVDIFVNNDIAQENSRIKNALRNYYFQSDFVCTVKSIKFSSVTKQNPAILKYYVCYNKDFLNLKNWDKNK